MQAKDTTRPCETCGIAFVPAIPSRRFCTRLCANAWQRTRRQPIAELLATRYVVTERGCWEWTGMRNDLGYGLVSASGRKKIRAHRAMWEALRGPIPDGHKVCHDCPGGDNPSCVNPAHLFLGTQKQNMEDAHRKGRTASGDRNGMRCKPGAVARGERHASKLHPELIRRGADSPLAKLTLSQAQQIRVLYQQGALQKTLAQQFGISRSRVSHIVNGQCYIDP